MGGVAVLHPQDCLTNNPFLTPVKYRRNPKPKSNPTTRSDGRKRRPNKPTSAMVSDPPAKTPLVMGQVKILKRGEPLDESLMGSNNTNAKAVDRKVTPAKKRSEKDKRNPKVEKMKIDDFALSSTNPLGPDPDMVPKQMNKNLADFFFAGSAFVDSPPPSSLPLPGFFTKSYAVKEDRSSDLRRILGLSF
ncbi:uncharacterized protein LOC143577850 [Bidens hawaiensis]|uniref:uncharacterized protein LOC143577850 n=1 Tax=Bidens hawaiensis TaxID=980011 RepID=UPI004048EB30